MKKKFIIIITILAIVGIATNAFADKSTPFTAITLDTNNDGFVDAIDVYITFTITDVQVNWANLTDDFEVGGYTSAVTVDGIDTGAFPNDNIFRVNIHSGTPNTIPTSTEDLLIEYT